MFGLGRAEIPEKPETHDDQMDMVWTALFNHIPTQLYWMNTKMTFILTFMALVLVLVAMTMAMVWGFVI